jgi:antitoxin CcdA
MMSTYGSYSDIDLVAANRARAMRFIGGGFYHHVVRRLFLSAAALILDAVQMIAQGAVMRIACTRGGVMKTMQTNSARKRAVNLTLNEDLVAQAKGMTANLSNVVEQLLTDYVAQQHSVRQDKFRNAQVATQGWNEFNQRTGAFADEHSTL